MEKLFINAKLEVCIKTILDRFYSHYERNPKFSNKMITAILQILHRKFKLSFQKVKFELPL